MWAADDCLCGGDEARQARNRELFAEFQAERDQMVTASNATPMRLRIVHFAPFALKRLGMSSRSGNLPRRQFLSAWRNLQFESIGGDLTPGFPCPDVEGVLGRPLTFLLVMT